MVNAEILEQSTISRSQFDYEPTLDSDYPARFMNPTERANSERVQIYDRYFMNDPKTLETITAKIQTICTSVPERASYPGTPEEYSHDRLYSKMASGLSTHLWATDNPGIWGDATLGKLEASINIVATP